MEINKIYNEDCIRLMERMQEEGININLVLTSPPYNTVRDLTSERARKNHEGRYDEYHESLSNADYDDFIINVFKHFDTVLAKNGCILWNVSYGNENPTQMWTSVTEICNKTDFTIADCIVWRKQTALPNNVSPNKLTRICEFVFVFCRKNEYDTFFMNKRVKSVSKKQQKIYENIYNYIEAPNNDGSNDLNKATFSTSFVRRLLMMYAKEGYLVYDPFMGTGTTAIGCVKEKCNYLGSEISKAQCEYAEQRIDEETRQLSLF